MYLFKRLLFMLFAIQPVWVFAQEINVETEQTIELSSENSWMHQNKWSSHILKHFALAVTLFTALCLCWGYHDGLKEGGYFGIEGGLIDCCKDLVCGPGLEK